jgi:hypothetical protein
MMLALKASWRRLRTLHLVTPKRMSEDEKKRSFVGSVCGQSSCVHSFNRSSCVRQRLVSRDMAANAVPLMCKGGRSRSVGNRQFHAPVAIQFLAIFGCRAQMVHRAELRWRALPCASQATAGVISSILTWWQLMLLTAKEYFCSPDDTKAVVQLVRRD